MAESEFTVLESYTRNVSHGVARIDKSTMDELSIVSVDTVEIIGKQRAVAKCLQLYPADEGKKTVRIDGLIRNNCKTKIGGIVSIKKIKSTPANSVMVAPLEAIPPLDPRYIAGALENVPVIPEPFVMVPYFGGRLTFMVAGIYPEISDEVRTVIVTNKTRFAILEKRPFSAHSNRDVEDRRLVLIQKIWNIEKMSRQEFDDFVGNLTEFYDLLSKHCERDED